MIWLKFWDCISDESKLLQLAHIESYVELAGKLHITMASGHEHCVASSWRDLEQALAQIPSPAPSTIIINL